MSENLRKLIPMKVNHGAIIFKKTLNCVHPDFQILEFNNYFINGELSGVVKLELSLYNSFQTFSGLVDQI